MKKTIIATIITLVSSIPLMGTPGKLDAKVSSEADYRATLAQILSQPVEKMKGMFDQLNFPSIEFKPEFAELRLAADAALANKGVGGRWWYSYTWPRMSCIARTKNGADVCYTNLIAMASRYKRNMDLNSLANSGATIDELIPCLSEITAFPKDCSFPFFMVDNAKRGIQKAAVVGIRKALRKQGKSFVSADGVNPCEKYMNRLNVALNAPRFAGLNAWLEELGFTARYNDLLLPTTEEVDKLKDAVFYGEQEMTARTRAILYVCLGVDGFNAFAKEYNGEK